MDVKCKKCGSTEVEVRTWVNPNTSEVSSLSDINSIISKREDCWCSYCGNDAELIVTE